jgi:hypothetical protein
VADVQRDDARSPAGLTCSSAAGLPTCSGVRPDAHFALRLRSHGVAAGLLRTELEAAAGVPAGRIRLFEDGTAKPHASTGARLAKALRAPDLQRFGEEREA